MPRSAVLALALLAALPAASPAATVGVSGTTLSVTDTGGVRNVLTVTATDGTFTVLDAAAPPVAAAGCSAPAPDRVTCPVAGVTALDVNAAGGDDEVTIAATTPASLDGGTGNDRLEGGTAADSVNGGTGTDAVAYATRGAPVSVTLASGAGDDGESGEGDTLTSIESAAGGAAGDVLAGSSAANALDGGPGDDRLAGAGGADTFTGGDGLDTVDYGDHTGSVVADLDDTADDGSSNERDNVRRDVETVLGGPGNDRLTGDDDADTLMGGAGSDSLTGNEDDDVLDGGTENDTLDGADGNDLVAGGAGADSLVAGDGTDLLDGGDGADALDGGAGDDSLDGGAGPDTLAGRDGQDRADYSARIAGVFVSLNSKADDGERGEGDSVSNDIERLLGGAGADRFTLGDAPNAVTGGAGDDTIDTGGGDDLVDGGPGNDVLRGRAGADALNGSAGNDDLEGGDGGDPLDGGDGDDVVNGEAGDDRLAGAAGKDALGGGLGNDRLDAGTGNDALDGGDGDDRVTGGAGDDRLDGGDGKDKLSAGVGKDKLTGGAGRDSFAAEDAADSVRANDGLAEKVSCGAGIDKAVTDRTDRRKSCEKTTFKTTSPAQVDQPTDAEPGLPDLPPSPGPPAGVRRVESGGKIVDIPGFPGERVDARLLPDVAWLARKYKIFVTDGFSLSPVHTRNGEHPLGLALDIVPDTRRGGTWDDIDALAKWAEPRQNQPRAPFRWVGYDGDKNHGRGNHLHLSWIHAPAKYNTRAAWVDVLSFTQSRAGLSFDPLRASL